MQIRFVKLTLTIFVLFFSIYILLTSSHVRLWADDFCTGCVFKQNGFSGSQKVSWNTWSGRFSYNFSQYFFLLLGKNATSHASIAVFIFIILSFWIVVYALMKSKHLFSSLVLSFVTTILVLAITPNITQSFYWYSGTLIYSLPFVFLNLFLFVFVRCFFIRTKKYLNLLIAAFLTLLVAGGFSESFAVAQITILLHILLTILLLSKKKKRQFTEIVIAGILGLFLAISLMLVSPGTAIRSATLTKPDSILWVFTTSFNSTKIYFIDLFKIKTYYYVAALIFSIVYYQFKEIKISRNYGINLTKSLILITLIISAVVFSTGSIFFVAYFSMAYAPPERALITSSYLIIIGLTGISVTLWLVIRTYITNKNTKIIDLMLLLVFFLSSSLLSRDIYRRWRFLKNDLATYAFQWDLQEKGILGQAANKKKINIKYIPPVGKIDGFIDNKGWVTGCAACYYGVEEFKVQK